MPVILPWKKKRKKKRADTYVSVQYTFWKKSFNPWPVYNSFQIILKSHHSMPQTLATLMLAVTLGIASGVQSIVMHPSIYTYVHQPDYRRVFENTRTLSRLNKKTAVWGYSLPLTNEEVRAKIQQAIGPHEDLLTIVKRRKLQWYGRVSRSSDLDKTILQGTVKGGERQGRQRKRWEDSMQEWTGLEFGMSQRAVENREQWRKLVAKASVVPKRPSRWRDWWWW